LEAGSLVAREVRVAAGLVAGRSSIDVGAYEDAAAWVDRVDALVTDQIDPRDRAELALLRCDTARAQGDRAAAVSAARRAAELARMTGDPMLLARSAEGWMMSLSGVGFDVGQPADRELVELMEQAIAMLPDDARRYQVRMRSMLSSVLVPEPDPARRTRLAAEALAIAELDGGSELMASAQLARRLALWQLDGLEERTEAVLIAVREARRVGNVQLQLTAMLFALSDLLELGRMDEHLAMLAEFRTRSSELHIPLFEVYALFIEASHELSAGNYEQAQRLADEALATGIRSHGVNAQVAYAGVWYRISLDLGRLPATIPEAERMLAANPRLRMWQIALVRALVADGRLDDARVLFEDLVGLDGVHMRDNQMFIPTACTLAEVAIVLGDRERAVVLRRALEPYAARIAVSGLAGISIGPVSGYVGLVARVAGDLDGAASHLRAAVDETVRFGMRAHEARARAALAGVLADRDGPGDQAASMAESAAAHEIADAIGLVLDS
jgi:tetratricopeptide (TPR) repeat protein